MHLQSITYMRAIAILIIVSGHTLWIASPNLSIVDKLVSNLLSSGTILFVFISGFMFHHVYYKEFSYKKFIIKKIRILLIPYIFMSIPFIIYFTMKGSGFYYNIDPELSITISIRYLLTGKAVYAYWYIPFAIILFSLSPLHIKFISLKLKYQLLLTFTLCIISIVIHRPIENLNVIHSLLYFSPVYIIGILVSVHYIKIVRYKYLFPVYLSISVLFLFLISLNDQIGTYHKNLFSLNGLDFQFIHKLFFCLFLITSLNYIENIKINTMNKIASASFAIFFIHPYVILLLLMIKSKLDITLNNNWLVSITIILLTVSLSYLIAKIIKFIFRNSNNTRLIIGH